MELASGMKKSRSGGESGAPGPPAPGPAEEA